LLLLLILLLLPLLPLKKEADKSRTLDGLDLNQ
jgi:hypothetical protein